MTNEKLEKLLAKLGESKDYFLEILSKIPESDKNDFVDDIACLADNNGTVNIDIDDLKEFLTVPSEIFYKIISANVDNIENEIKNTLETSKIEAENIVIIVSCGVETTLSQIYVVADCINSIILEDTNVLFGAIIDDKHSNDTLKITLLANGIK